jgi:prepilin-type processing-associated H-X9-DG protein
VFAKAREKARTASCQSNLKQLALGVLMYSQDYDERFPWGWNTTSGYGAGDWDRSQWCTLIYPYVKNVQLYTCPSSNIPPSWLENGADGIQAVRNEHYKWNAYLGVIGGGPGAGPTCAWPWPPVKHADITEPARTAMLCDATGNLFYSSTPACAQPYFTGGDPVDCSNYNPTWRCHMIATWHNGGSNVAFCDGHVKWMKTQTLVGDGTDEYWKTTR